MSPYEQDPLSVYSVGIEQELSFEKTTMSIQKELAGTWKIPITAPIL